MPTHRTLRTAGATATGTVVPLLLAALLWTPAHPASARGPPPAGVAIVAATDPAGNLSLAVLPGSWTMEPGSSLVLTTALSGVPPDAYVEAGAPLWSVPLAGQQMAWLNASEGSSVRATTYGGSTGFFSVVATLTGTLVTPTGSTPFSVSGAGMVTLLRGLTLGDLAMTPDPARPGTPVTVAWDAFGGAPPYALSVAFGDGNTTTIVQTAPGNGSVVHRFPSGVFTPALSLSDQLGSELTDDLAAPLIVSNTLSVALLGSTPTPESGRPVWFNASVQGGVAPFSYAWAVDGVVAGTPAGNPASLEVPAPSSGSLTVAVSVEDSVGAFGSTERRLLVAAPPALSAHPVLSVGEVGRPYLVNVSLTGGVGPYTLGWGLAPGGPSGSLNLSANGSLLLDPVPPTAAPTLLELSVADAAGGHATAAIDIGPFGPPPYVATSPLPATIEAGRPLALDLRVVGGVAPYAWSLEPSFALANSSPMSGTLGANGSVGWSGTPTGSGNLTFHAFVLDALGAATQANASVAVAPALALRVAYPGSRPTAGVAFPVDLDLIGGLPPYTVVAAAGDGAAVALNLSAPGPSELDLVSPSAGFVGVVVSVTDAGGVTVNHTDLLEFGETAASGSAPPASSPPTGNPAAATADSGLGLAGAALVVAGVAVVLVVVRGRRPARGGGGPAGAEAGRALEVVRRLLVESDGCDAESLGLIAEEEGIPPDAVRAAVARWERAGRVHRAVDGLGSEVYRWSSGAAPSGGPAPEGET